MSLFGKNKKVIDAGRVSTIYLELRLVLEAPEPTRGKWVCVSCGKEPYLWQFEKSRVVDAVCPDCDSMYIVGPVVTTRRKIIPLGEFPFKKYDFNYFGPSEIVVPKGIKGTATGIELWKDGNRWAELNFGLSHELTDDIDFHITDTEFKFG